MSSSSWIHALTLSIADTSVPDGELLARFSRTGDGAAFELLVRRHAEMVWRVCRSELPRDRHSAEDAFQTAFLVLARKAGSVRGGTVAGFLFRVARHAALRVRKRVGTVAEASFEVGVEPAEPAEGSVAVIEEVERLPDKFRLPVLLCFFEDCTHVEAANRLGWAVGTVASRLARAKDRLRVRLTRRGLALPAVLAGISVPTMALRAAVTMATTPSAVPTLLTELTREVLIVMAQAKAKWIGGGVLATLLLTGGLGMMVLTAGPTPEEPKPVVQVKPGAKVPEKETPEAAELKKLQGVWRVTKLVGDAGVATAKEIEPMRWHFAGDIVSPRDDPEQKEKRKLRIALEPMQSPKRITLTQLTGLKDEIGDKLEGIYEFKGDALRICIAGEPGKARPTEFKAEKGGDTGLIELERIPKADEKETPEAAELKKLQGKWRVTRMENKRGVAPADVIEAMNWEFAGDTISAQDGPDRVEKQISKFEIDATKSPKRITITMRDGPKGEVAKRTEGIYELTDGKLRVCMMAPGLPRPTEFKVDNATDGGLIEFERIPKPAEKETLEAAELKKLQGVWQVTKIETNRGVAPAKVIEPMRWEIVGSTVTAIDGPGEKQRSKSRIALDGTKSPKRIAQTALTEPGDKPGRKIEGIYEVKGDKLRICFGEVGKEFPTEFKVEKGADMGLIELERIPKPDKKAPEKKVLTPDQIIQGKIEGEVQVEFTVESLYWETGTSTEKTIPMNFKLRGEKTDGDLFQVQVADRVFTRLSELGIEDTPKEHFVGKTVRVNGVLKRLPLARRDGFLYFLRIDSLDQIESVSKK